MYLVINKSPHNYPNRIKLLRQKLKKKEIDVILISKPANRFYLSGFDGSTGFLLISQEKAMLIVDFRYIEQARQQSPHMEIYQLKKHFSEAVSSLVKREGWNNLVFEEEYVTYINYKWLEERAGVPIKPQQQIIEKLRAVKETGEIDLIRQAAHMTDEAFQEIRRYLRPGIKETEVAAELEYILRKKGAEGPSFRFIVASGHRSAWPHGVASPKKLEAGELVTLDFGICFGGYASDMTRTVFLGNPDKRHQEVWRVVADAQKAAFDGLKKGVKGSEIDALARKVIEDAGMGENFGHGLGHGLGLEAHEAPLISQKGKEKLVPGMVITIEPGIYIEGWGGIRIEDMVLIKDEGYEILSSSPRNLVL